MAKVLNIELPFECIFGKLSKNSDIVIRRRRVDDYHNLQVYTLHPYQGEYSEAQKAQQNIFKKANESVKNLTKKQHDAYFRAFKRQKKYITLRGYIVAKEIEKIKIINK